MDDDFVEKLAEMANAAPVSDAESLKEHLAKHDIVFGVWQDLKQPNGVDYLVVKGENWFREISASGEAANTKISAVSCREFAEAEAMRRTFGDKVN